MQLFSKFLENEDLEVTKATRVNPAEQLPTTNRIKLHNLNFARSLLERNPRMLLGQLSAFDDANPGQISDMLDFAVKHEFEDTLPLEHLIGIYQRVKK